MNIEHTRPRSAPGPTASPLGGLVKRARGTLKFALKIALGLIGLVLLLGALMLGLMLAIGIVIWARLRGRKAVPGVFKAAFAKARHRPSVAAGDVVDVEVREVPDTASQSRKF